MSLLAVDSSVVGNGRSARGERTRGQRAVTACRPIPSDSALPSPHPRTWDSTHPSTCVPSLPSPAAVLDHVVARRTAGLPPGAGSKGLGGSLHRMLPCIHGIPGQTRWLVPRRLQCLLFLTATLRRCVSGFLSMPAAPHPRIFRCGGVACPSRVPALALARRRDAHHCTTPIGSPAHDGMATV